MPVVNTSQTFNTGDTVTSTSLNNIMDQSIFVDGAVVTGDGLTVTAGGQMTIENLKITGAKIANQTVTQTKLADANVTQTKLAPNVVGNGPYFRAYKSVAQAIPNNSDTKVTFDTEEYDTNSNFESSRFTPTIAGHYLIRGSVAYAASRNTIRAFIFKNSSLYSQGDAVTGSGSLVTVCDTIYLNGSSDFVEIFTKHNDGASVNTGTGSALVNFSGCLIRSA